MVESIGRALKSTKTYHREGRNNMIKDFREWLSEQFGWEIDPIDLSDEDYYMWEDLYYEEMEEQK